MKSNLEPVYLEVNTLSEAWYQCLRYLIKEDHGHHTYTIDQGSYAGQKRLEFDYLTIAIRYPNTRPLIPDVPQGIPNPSSADYLNQYYLKLVTCQKDKNEEYTYGERIESQIMKLVEKYNAGPGNNQCILQVAGPEDINLKDPPCLRHIDTRIIDGKLHFVVYFRSWDLWAGFPNNLGAIQMLKEAMAKEMMLADGNIIASSKGLHLYEYARPLAEQVVNR